MALWSGIAPIHLVKYSVAIRIHMYPWECELTGLTKSSPQVWRGHGVTMLCKLCFFLAFTPFLLLSCLFDSTIRFSGCSSLVAWRMCGLLGSCSLSFILSLDWVLLGQRSSSSCRAHVFLSCVRGPLGNWSCHITSSCLLQLYLFFFFFSCYLVGLRADALAMPAHFFINLLLKASLAYFPHLYLFWVLLANIPIMLAYFIFLRLPRLIYFLFTSFILMGFLVDPLGFLSSITTSLHFITFWVIGL